MKNLSYSPPGKILLIPVNPAVLLLYAKEAELCSSAHLPPAPSSSQGSGSSIMKRWQPLTAARCWEPAQKSKEDQQGRATYQLRRDLKLSAAGRAHGGEGQRGAPLLPGLPWQDLSPDRRLPHGCRLPPQPATSLLLPSFTPGLLNDYSMSTCLGQQVSEQTLVINLAWLLSTLSSPALWQGDFKREWSGFSVPLYGAWSALCW